MAFGSATLATSAVASAGPAPGMASRRLQVSFDPEHQAPVKNADLLPYSPGLNGKGYKAGADKVRNAIIPAIIDDGNQSIHASASHWGNDPELSKMRPNITGRSPGSAGEAVAV